MKRNLLLTLAFAAAMTATATTLQPIEKYPVTFTPMQQDIVSGYVQANPEIIERNNAAKVTSRAETPTMTFGYCDNPATALSFSNQSVGNIIRLGAEVTEKVAKQFAGTTVTAINVAGGTNNALTTNPAPNVKVFLTYDLDEDPFYSQDATLSSEPFAWNKVVLDKPYTIEANKPFFYGFEITLTEEHLTGDCFYVVVDGKPTSNLEGGWYRVPFDGKYVIESICQSYGNICTTIDLTGDKLPTGFGAIEDVKTPISATAGAKFPFSFLLKNAGADDLVSGEIEVSINNGPAQATIPFDLGNEALKYNAEGWLGGEFTITEPGDEVKFTVTLTKVNGKPNNTTDGSQTESETLKVFAEGKGYKRAVVIEEGTGTWCGFCPAGIVLLEHARKTYTDGSMICIAVHSGDEMAVYNYTPFIGEYFSGFPQYVINRYQREGLTPLSDLNNEVLEYAYNDLRTAPAYAKIDLNVEFADAEKTSINCYSQTTTCENTTNSMFRVAYVVVEDKVGPYEQTNYFGPDDKIGDWGTYGGKKEWVFDDVAREIINWEGVYGSLPAEMTADEVYKHTQNIKIPAGVNTDNCRVVAMLINAKNGTVENAVQTTISGVGGVESVLGDNEAVNINGVSGAIAIDGNYTNATVYNFDGTTATVANGANMIAMPAGMYIVKVDNVVKKVVVR